MWAATKGKNALFLFRKDFMLTLLARYIGSLVIAAMLKSHRDKLLAYIIIYFSVWDQNVTKLNPLFHTEMFEMHKTFQLIL